MQNQPLQFQLEKLHAELQKIDVPDAKERELLRTLEQDIKTILEHDRVPPEQYSGLGERLKDAIAKLEASHPKTTLSMRQVIDQLSFLGI